MGRVSGQQLDAVREIGYTGKVLLLCCFVGFALARTPSPCLVAKLTNQPAVLLLAVDYCRMDGYWRQEKAAQTPVPALAILRNVTSATSTLCNVYAHSADWYSPVCDVPRTSLCFSGPAAVAANVCETVNAFVADRVKMCHCGLLPGCTNGLECIYGPELLRQVQHSREACSWDNGRAVLERKHAHAVLNATWGQNATVGPALAALDACVTALHGPFTYNRRKRRESLAARYAAFRETNAAAARTAGAMRRVACMLVAEAISPTTPLVADMVTRWQLKYCGLHGTAHPAGGVHDDYQGRSAVFGRHVAADDPATAGRTYVDEEEAD